MKLEVFVDGFLAGAVCGKDRIDAMNMARKYFPDVTSVKYNLGHVGDAGMVWISPRFALFVDGYWQI